MSAKFTMALGGAEKLIRELKLANPRTRANVGAAIRKNTKAVVEQAKSRIHSRTGELASTVRDEYSDDGLVGYGKAGFGKLPRRSKAQTAKGKARAKGRTRNTGKGAFAPVIDRGDPRRNIEAQHFLSGPFQRQKATAVSDISNALNKSVQEIG